MVIQQRLRAVRRFIEDGHDVHIAYSHSSTSGRIKVKIWIGAASGVVPHSARPFISAALQPMLGYITHVVIDRGHHFSDGHAVTNFWVTPRSHEVPAQKGSDFHTVASALRSQAWPHFHLLKVPLLHTQRPLRSLGDLQFKAVRRCRLCLLHLWQTCKHKCATFENPVYAGRSALPPAPWAMNGRATTPCRTPPHWKNSNALTCRSTRCCLPGYR